MKDNNKLLSIAFIIIGLSLLLYPIYTNWQVKQTQASMKEEWEQLNNVTFAQPETHSSSEDTNKQQTPLSDKELQNFARNMKEETINPKVLDRKAAKEHALVGDISIPKIGLKAMIVPGVSEKSLKDAIGWMPSTALPDEQGNMVLAGHRSHTYGKFFNRLNEVEKGEMIEVNSHSGNYTYKITEKTIVEPSNLSVIQPTGTNTVTLITCHPKNSDRYRLIVKAEQQ